MKSIKTCAWCGKKIKHPCGIYDRYCSKKCDEAARQNDLEINNPEAAYFAERIKDMR